MPDWPEEFDALLRAHCRLVAPDSPINPDRLLTQLGVDSLEVVEMIVSIEDAFGISIPPDRLTPAVFATASTVWQMVTEVKAAQGAAKASPGR